MLERAATANAEVAASRLDPLAGLFLNLDQARIHAVTAPTFTLRHDGFARQSVGHEYRLAVLGRQTIAAATERRDVQGE